MGVVVDISNMSVVMMSMILLQALWCHAVLSDDKCGDVVLSAL